MQIKTTQKGHIAWCQDEAQALPVAGFSMAYWQDKDAIVGQSKGRYTTWFVQANAHFPRCGSEQHWVLRHYWRGGLIEKFSKDAYIYTGLERTRAVAELALLEKLYQEGFAVPRPIAANVERFGIWYRADIIIERVPLAKDLVAHLSSDGLTPSQWHALGETLAQFHQRGVYHADLNAKNILFDANKFYLIDFDRGELRPQQSSWQQANLARLLRSFNKEHAKLTSLNFSLDNWQSLMTGYQASMK
ncbi:3-deoxy-D-manno-octulosonic acid kinase [Shewanella sp. SR44-3]|uniref:3-deoxy-D-manno-octulosonic acid kinase n=1 Tax=unclassified Shewanella TaxID=196818 RepID=UPI0015FAACCD|nr:3-deoxy-D-manno-octulosonic acid kinase [Shewanella sp. SR44-3]MBB1268424.1 3-deoxy-D-manno-octulosonic acid kinase [Shewanella sp. SR44-3]